MTGEVKKARSVRSLGAAFAAMCAISIAFVAGLGFLVVYVQDRNAVTASETFVQSNLDGLVRTHETLTKEYGYWDQTVLNVVETLDIAWVESELGEYLFENGEVNVVHVLDEQGRVVLGQTAGITDSPPDATPLAAGELELAARALGASEKDTEPVAVSAYTRQGDDLQMSSAIRITDYDDDGDYSTGHVLIFHWKMDADFMASLERASLVRDLRWMSGETGYGSAPVAIDLPGDGDARLVWQPDLPGSQMLPLLLAVLFGFVLLMVVIGLVFVRRVSVHARHLVEAQQASDAANRHKSDFLASMSHELRTPLNAILGFAEVMKKQYLGPVGNTRYLEYADDIHRSGSHLLSLVNGLLDLSKIEAGKFDIAPVELRLADVVGQSLRMVGYLAEEKGIALESGIAEGAEIVYADERALRQVLVNILGNALKFTPEDGRVSLRAFRSPDGMVACLIRDTGVGIKESDIPLVLEPFFQIREEGFVRHRGTGLGLPVARRLVELMRGTLTIDSVVGSGTTVTVRLPSAAGNGAGSASDSGLRRSA